MILELVAIISIASLSTFFSFRYRLLRQLL
ncbi:hypothetical protein SAMN04488603_10134 [Paenibacillus sp. cl130]|nr:hypothetical protein SAMN04488603_10134 [Paenibacillus sp. cl130]